MVLKTFFLISEQQNGFTVWGEDIPLRKWSIILKKKKKKLPYINEKTMRGLTSYFKNILFFIFFCKKNDIKGQNKSPVILTKIKVLLFVQEQNWNLLSW